MLRALMLAAVAFVFYAPSRADACVCILHGFPQSGSVDVPINAQPLVWRSGPTELAMRAALTGVEVAIETDLLFEQRDYALLQVKPQSPLAPNTEYEITGGGFSSFTTGTQIDKSPPRPPVLSQVWPQRLVTDHFECSNDCRSGDRVLSDASFVDGSAYHYVQIEGNGETHSIPRPYRRRIEFGGGCDPSFLLEPGVEYCVQLFAVSLNGSRAASEPICSTASVCLGFDDGTCNPAQQCAPSSAVANEGCAASNRTSGGSLVPLFLFILAALAYRRKR